MFNGVMVQSEQMGAQEEYGPEKPTAVQVLTQSAMDMTGLQKTILYAVGAGVIAYFAYQYFYGE
jgi:hypothetical protein